MPLPSSPFHLSPRACVVLAALGVAAGLGLRFMFPVTPPDPTFTARIQQWNDVASELKRKSHAKREKERP